MQHLKNEYLKAKLELSKGVIGEHLSGWKVGLDKKIKDTVYLLNCHGFSTTMSCEGHIPPYKGANTFRLFWPYVEIELIHNTVFHLEERKPRMETVSGDFEKNFSKLGDLIFEFNQAKHPFSEKHLEISTLLVSEVDSLITPLEFNQAIKKHWGIKALVCDKGVQGILTMPQELLNGNFRRQFLKRTQHQMDLFTKFLEWQYLHPDGEEKE